MKTKLILFVLISTFGSVHCKSQEAKLEDVLSSYYKATGIDKIKDWMSFVTTGKSISQGTEYPFTAYIKLPDKIRTEAEVQGNKMVQVLNGDHGWSVIPWSGSSDPQEMTPDEIKGMKDQLDVEGTLYDWKKKGHKVELLGKEDMEGSQVYKIKVTKADGDIETWFIDAESYIPLKTASIVKTQGNETEYESVYSNYNDYNGVLIAKTIANKFKGQTVSSIQFDKMDINVPISDSLFVKPVKK
jgi:outer membrane lipoprotein-sorting protein